MEKYSLHNPGSEDDAKVAESKIKERFDVGAVNLEGKEREKTPAEFRMLHVIGSQIKEFGNELGIPLEGLPPERYHILSPEDYGVYIRREEGAHYFADLDSVTIMDSDDSESDKYRIWLHESIHSIGFKSFSTVNADKFEAPVRRSGYHVVDLRKGKEHTHLNGFDEMVVEKITYEIARKHDKENREILGASVDEFIYKETDHYYITILNNILKRISEFQGKTTEEVWGKYKKEYLTGNLMHLREIESVCGKGSLRILDLVGREMGLFDDDPYKVPTPMEEIRYIHTIQNFLTDVIAYFDQGTSDADRDVLRTKLMEIYTQKVDS